MERELWRMVIRSLRRLPRRWPSGAVYSNHQILAVLLWAALHDRPISWACRRRNWPMQAWRRVLPDQSTMSRRLRDPALLDDLRRVAVLVQRTLGAAHPTLLVDGKPLEVSEYTADPDAAVGWSIRRFSRGYKLHALIDLSWRVHSWRVTPLNEAESVVAQELVREAEASATLMYADASYDSNNLHRVAADCGVRLVAPRRRPHKGIGKNQRHHPNRLASIALTEHDASWHDIRTRVRPTIERYFGALASVGGGLWGLPPWVRRLHRVRVWVGAKMALHAARITMIRAPDA